MLARRGRASGVTTSALEAWMTSPVGRRGSTPAIVEPLPVGPLAIAGGGVLLVSMAAFFRVSLLPSIGDELALSAADLGIMTMAFGIGRLLTDLPAGRFADRAVPGTAFAMAGALVAAGSFVLAAARTGVVAYAAAFALGIGSSIANTTGMTVFSAVPHGRRGTAMAVFSACLLGGQSFGPVLAGGISALGSWRTAEAAAGVLGLATAAVLLARRRASQGRGDAKRPARPGPAAELTGRAERVVLYGISFVAFFTLAAMPQTLVPIIGADAFGLGAGAIGLALGLGGACRFVGALSGGVVADRLGRKAALVPGLGLNTVGIALLAIDGGVWLWVTGIVLMSLGSFGVSVAATLLADRSRSGGVGRRLGRFRFSGDLGVIAGPAIAGALFASAGRGTAVLVVAALPATLAVAAALLLTETRGIAKPAYEPEAVRPRQGRASHRRPG
jgi:MFS family permease